MNDLSTQIEDLFVKMRRVQARTHAEVGIVGAAIIEERLEKTLLTKMRPLSNTMRQRLFDGYGPLSSFSAKIDLSYALQLIDKQTQDDLTTIRKIRNQFAHSLELVNFDSPEIIAHFRIAPGAAGSKTDYQALYLGLLKSIEARIKHVTPETELSTKDPLEPTGAP